MAPLFPGMPEEYTPGIEWLATASLLHCRCAVGSRGGPRYEVQGCDSLALRDGRITAKRSYRKGSI